jgi:hypothetical protein
MNYMQRMSPGQAGSVIENAWVNCDCNSRDRELEAGEKISRALIARLIARTRLC